MRIFHRFILACFAQALHIDTPTPIFSLKTKILKEMNLKKPGKPQFPQITTISLFNAVNLRKEFRRFWFRYRTLLLFYPTHLAQNVQKNLCRYHQFSYGNSTILCRFRANYACIDRNCSFAEQKFWTKADLFGKIL